MILALDPSLRFFGALIFDCDGVPRLARWKATTTKDDDETKPLGDVRRIRELREWLNAVWTDARSSNSSEPRVIIEIPSGARGAGGHICKTCGGQHVPGVYRSAKAEGMVLALTASFFAARTDSVTWVQPQDAKKALLGKRSGGKDEMVAAAGQFLKTVSPPFEKMSIPAKETIADCYAIALAGGAKKP